MIYYAVKRAARGCERGPWAAAQCAPVPARTSSKARMLTPVTRAPPSVAPQRTAILAVAAYLLPGFADPPVLPPTLGGRGAVEASEV